MNVEPYSTFSSLCLYHRVVVAKLKLSLRVVKTPPKLSPYDWSVMESNKDLQELYTVKVKNRYSELCNDDMAVTSKYQAFMTANEEATKELIPHKRKTRKKISANDPRICEARQNVNSAFSSYQHNPTKDAHIALQTEKQNLQNEYDCVYQEDLDNIIRRVEDADIRSQHGMSWKLINQISGRKSTKKGKLKGATASERIKSWYDHFNNLLGKEPTTVDPDVDVPIIFDTIGVKTGPFTMDEYQEVKKRLKSGKASGADGIPPEVLKYCNLDDIILQYANNLLFNNEKPNQWSDINILPLPKSGDLGLTKNYRGISLTSIVAKVVNRLILNRIQPKLDPLLRPNQNGYRPGRSTASHILALRRIIEGVKRHNLKAVLLFVDFKRAFDSVHREKMMRILRAYGIPDELVAAISKLYEDTRAKVISPDGDTEFFKIVAGVLQGDTLAPYLFAIVIDWVMRNTINDCSENVGFTLQRRRSRRQPAVEETDLALLLHY